MEQFYTYKLSTNGIPFYIGKGKKTETYDRINYHLNYWYNNKNKKLVNKIKNLNGIFDIEILFESKNEQECLDLEVKLIKEIGRKNLCNLTDGGEGVSGFHHTDEAKNKISIWRKGKSFSSETCERITQNKTGNTYKLNKIPEGKIEELYTTKGIYEISNELGLHFTTIKRYLESKNLYIPNKNRKPVSEYTKAKMSSSIKGTHTKAVYQFDIKGTLLNKFNSLNEAISYAKLSGRGGDIQQCCKQKTNTAYGYIWRFSEECVLPKKISYAKQPLIQYDLDGNFIKEWDNCKDAEGAFLSYSKNNIASCCYGRQKTAYGYIWKFKI